MKKRMKNYHWMIYLKFYSLFHETFRTNLVLEPTLEGENLVFGFNGFKGTYDISVELEDGTVILVNDQFVLSD